jgi:hypothetical protein
MNNCDSFAGTPRRNAVVCVLIRVVKLEFRNIFRYFCAVLGAPSAEDIDELAQSAFDAGGETAKIETAALLKSCSSLCFSPEQRVVFSERYSHAAAVCPEALQLLERMLSYSPSKRVSCSAALRHSFLNPHSADVSVDAFVGEDGHARAKRAAVSIRQLHLEQQCANPSTLFKTIADLLAAEAVIMRQFHAAQPIAAQPSHIPGPGYSQNFQACSGSS